jgi:hypothetical protein
MLALTAGTPRHRVRPIARPMTRCQGWAGRRDTGASEADGALLAYLAIVVDDDMVGVAVNAHETGDFDVNAARQGKTITATIAQLLILGVACGD